MSSEGSLKASKVGVAGLEAEVPGSEGSEETCPQPHEGGPLAIRVVLSSLLLPISGPSCPSRPRQS